MNGPNIPVRNIIIHVNYDGGQHELRTFTNEYRSLMALIYDRIYTEGFGDCLGMGKCGTCLVQITGKQTELTAYERNEDITLLKSAHTRGTIRLACQLMPDEKMNGLTINVLT
jgi:2Fe-2S ferredoxin